MSVQTTADEHLDEVKSDIKSAIKNLNIVIDPDTWGHDEFKREYRKELLDVYKQLLDIRDKIE